MPNASIARRCTKCSLQFWLNSHIESRPSGTPRQSVGSRFWWKTQISNQAAMRHYRKVQVAAFCWQLQSQTRLKTQCNTGAKCTFQLLVKKTISVQISLQRQRKWEVPAFKQHVNIKFIPDTKASQSLGSRVWPAFRYQIKPQCAPRVPGWGQKNNIKSRPSATPLRSVGSRLRSNFQYQINTQSDAATK